MSGRGSVGSSFGGRVLGKAVILVLACVPGPGCKRNPAVIPVTGKIFYNDQALPFGTITFQPERGQPGSGDIQEDGTFRISTYAADDGAVPGRHRICVSCYEGQRPGRSQRTASGKLLVPLKYAEFATSGLTADVKDASGQTFEFRLEGPPLK